MISKKLKIIFLVSIIFFYIYGIEEVMNNFYHVDSFILGIANFFDTIPQAVYWISHMAWWLLLVIVLLFLIGGRWMLHLMAVYGLILVFESHHLIKAFMVSAYYPGMVTALFFPVIAFFFWRELLKLYRSKP